MTTVYLAIFPIKWNLKPAVYMTESDIQAMVMDYAKDQEKSVSKEDWEKIEDRVAEKLYVKSIETLSSEGRKSELVSLTLDGFKRIEAPLIKAATMKHLSEKTFDTYFRRVMPTIREIAIEKADKRELREIEDICLNHGYPDNKVFEAIEFRKYQLRWEQEALGFYSTARITNSIPRGHRGTAKLQYEYPRMVRLRYYKGKKGDVRRTVEIELP